MDTVNVISENINVSVSAGNIIQASVIDTTSNINILSEILDITVTELQPIDVTINDIVIKYHDKLLNLNWSNSGHTIDADLDIDYHNIINVGNIQFDLSYTPNGESIGAIYWNMEDDTVDIVNSNGVRTQVGQELNPLYKNQSGEDMEDGTPVMYAGSLGASGRILLQKAIADGSFSGDFMLGVTTERIANGGDGHVTWFGNVRGLPTDGAKYGEVWNDGDIIYVSPTTAGFLTNIQPEAPNIEIAVGVVVSAHATMGTLGVRPVWSNKLADLADVNGTPLTTDGQILVWDNARQVFDFNYNLITELASRIKYSPATINPTENGELLVEVTNDTKITFKLRGSDSVIRSGTITLS